jgi:hypothetical protein
VADVAGAPMVGRGATTRAHVRGRTAEAARDLGAEPATAHRGAASAVTPNRDRQPPLGGGLRIRHQAHDPRRIAPATTPATSPAGRGFSSDPHLRPAAAGRVEPYARSRAASSAA